MLLPRKRRMIRIVFTGLFWVLLPAFGISIGYGLLSLQMFKAISLFQFAQILGGWVLLWGFFALAAKQVFQNQTNLSPRLKQISNHVRNDQPGVLITQVEKDD